MEHTEDLRSVFSPSEEEKWKQAVPQLRRFQQIMAYYRCAMMEIETKFNVLNEEFSLRLDRNPISDIRSRLKKPVAIGEKLARRGVEWTLENMERELYDIAGVRVICGFEADVYQLADALLKQDDVTLICRKDYIRTPKENGYRSLHLIVTVPVFLAREKKLLPVEIQLRTIAMDSWASLEHQLRYKKDYEMTEEQKRLLSDCALLAHQLDEKMDFLRREILEPR